MTMRQKLAWLLISLAIGSAFVWFWRYLDTQPDQNARKAFNNTVAMCDKPTIVHIVNAYNGSITYSVTCKVKK